MLIGIDGNEANVKERVGVNVWAFELLKQFKRVGGEGQGRNSPAFVIYLSKPPVEDMPEEGQAFRYRIIGPSRFWTRLGLPLDLYLHRPQPDIFFSLSHYSPLFAPIPKVVSIMDLSFFEYPEAFKALTLWQLKNWTKESIKKADHVIAISEFTKNEIVKYYKYPFSKITVVYPGISKMPESSIWRKYGIQGKYILFVGTLQPKKNLPRLIKAFELIKKKFPEIDLVIAGKIWKQFERDEALSLIEGSHPSIKSSVKYVGFVPEKDLWGLMAAAEGLVLPSLYEGFGIPAIEAMISGTPVLASNVSSLSEIIGEAGVLFDPYSIDDMAEKICLLLNMTTTERQQLVKRGMIRAGMFSWNKSAKRIVDLLRLITQNEGHC